MNKFIWIILIILGIWIGIVVGQNLTIYQFNAEIERLATENGALASQKRQLRATIGRLEAELTIRQRGLRLRSEKGK